CATLKLW
nr:immunoglobulin heavy chain junction region [Macaca mulatta]MOV88569.1 immunoglobulin heavy chain junction region [Macaca mulatta]MOV88754.1 immunoglobulin heavy chain junction region [Macaca mulatta]MOV89291.1 immunoglobulin heavy chain junction region [Macaca mulatta]MOV90250.1 immunoglobulin heavy chain junction region [Macaca mulatta]